jgi:microcystin-dependent protein
VPIGAGQAANGTSYPLGSTGGQEAVTLTASQMPAHAHPVRANDDRATTKNPTGNVPAAGGAYAETPNVRMDAAMISRSGRGEAHENRQPYLALNYVIALEGSFPPRA